MAYGHCDAASHALNLVECCPHKKGFRAVKIGTRSGSLMGRLCLFVLLSQITIFRAPALARNDDGG